MKVIDFHTHVFPDDIALPAVEKMSQAAHIPHYTDGTEDCLRRSMEEACFARSVVLPVATNPLKAGHINTVNAEKNDRGDIIYFGCIHPDQNDWYEELGRISNLGFRGIKVHPAYQHVDFDDIRYLRILERCAELDLICVTHAGRDIGLPQEYRCTPEMILNAIDETGIPKLVLAHMGCWGEWESAADMLAGTGVYIDTSFSQRSHGSLDGYYCSEGSRMLNDDRFTGLIRRYGADHTLFGTDSPWTDQKEALEIFLELPLTVEEKKRILYGNAEKLLGLD